MKFFVKYDVQHYYGNPEIGKKTGKEHYQMIIWINKIEDKDEEKAMIVKMRNYWRGKLPKKKGGRVSLVKAQSEERLLGYCRKDEKNSILTNVSKEIYTKYKKYESLKAVKMKNQEKLQKIIGGISRNLTKNEYLMALNQAYYKVYEKPCLRKQYYITHLYKAGYWNDQDIVDEVMKFAENRGKDTVYQEYKVEWTPDGYGMFIPNQVEIPEQQNYLEENIKLEIRN